MIQHPNPSRRSTPEERRFLDALCYWRSLYAERGPQDSRSVASIASTIYAAELRMRALRVRDIRYGRRFIGGEVSDPRPPVCRVRDTRRHLTDVVAAACRMSAPSGRRTISTS